MQQAGERVNEVNEREGCLDGWDTGRSSLSLIEGPEAYTQAAITHMKEFAVDDAVKAIPALFSKKTFWRATVRKERSSPFFTIRVE